MSISRSSTPSATTTTATRSPTTRPTPSTKAALGPTYYSFNLGRIHYIVLDDMVYKGSNAYDTRIDDRQMEWLRQGPRGDGPRRARRGRGDARADRQRIADGRLL